MNATSKVAAGALIVGTLAFGANALSGKMHDRGPFGKQLPKIELIAKDSVICLPEKSAMDGIESLLQLQNISDSSKMRFKRYGEIMLVNAERITIETKSHGNIPGLTINFNKNKRDYQAEFGKGEGPTEDRKTVENQLRSFQTCDQIND